MNIMERFSHSRSSLATNILPMNAPASQDTPLLFPNSPGPTPARLRQGAFFTTAATTQARHHQGNETRALLDLALALRHQQDTRVALFLQNQLTNGMLASSAIPVQHGQQHHNYHVHYPPSDASSTSVAMASAQGGQCQHVPAEMIKSLQSSVSTNSSNTGLSSRPNKIAAAPPSRNHHTNTTLFSPSKAGFADIASKEMLTIPPSTSAAGILIALGSRSRNKVGPYVDVSDISLGGLELHHGVRGGVIHPFPRRLHHMLQQVEAQGDSDIISFYPHGRALAILNPERFEAEILPKFLPQQRQIKSFVRQLNLYGFIKIKSGPDTGGYYHELFLKGRPELSQYMRRVGATQKVQDNLAHSGASSSTKKHDACGDNDIVSSSLQPRILRSQPNFYGMKMSVLVSPDPHPIYYT
jgi:hypothetical protein